MLHDYISIGNKLELINLNTNDNGEVKTYVSKLLDFIEKDKAQIAMPIEKGRVIPLSVGDKYIICFYTDGGLFQCKAVITSRFKNDNMFILEVQFVSELEKYQRRQFYRMECNMNVSFHIITDAERILASQIKLDKFETEDDKNKCLNNYEELANVWQEGTITDISGGGLRINSKCEINPGDNVIISLNLLTSEGEKKLIIKVRIISSIRIPNRWGFFENRVQFKEITKEEREVIVKYIFDEDRRRRRKEKGLD